MPRPLGGVVYYRLPLILTDAISWGKLKQDS